VSRVLLPWHGRETVPQLVLLALPVSEQLRTPSSSGRRALAKPVAHTQSVNLVMGYADALSESNLGVLLALPVSEQLRTQSTGKASGTHSNRKLSHGLR